MRVLNVAAVCFLLAVLLAESAWVRLDGIRTQGVTTGDAYDYVREAELWAKGEPPKFYKDGQFYRPAAYLLHGWAMRLWGINDYSIKLLHVCLDLLNIALIFGIGAALARNAWPGLAAALLYALLPNAVFFARSEMVHTLSMTFLLASFAFFVAADQFDMLPRRYRHVHWAFLALSGVSLGIAANTHHDLAFLAPAYVLFIAARRALESGKAGLLWPFFGRAALYAFALFSPYLLGLIVFGPREVIRVFSREFAGGRGDIAAFGNVPRPRLDALIFEVSLRDVFGGTWVVIAVLFGAAALVMAAGPWLRRRPLPTAYLPPFLIAAYIVLFATLASAFPQSQARLFFPLIPFVLVTIAVWLYASMEQALRRFTPLVFAPAAALLFFFSPKALPGEYDYQTPERAVYEVLKDRVDADNRLLIAPVIARTYGATRGYEFDMYFGRNARYLWNIPMPRAYTLESLREILDGHKFNYIFLCNLLDTQFLTLPDSHLPGRETYRTWLHNDAFRYSLDEDIKTIMQYIRERKGVLLATTRFGPIYRLDPPPEELPIASGDIAVNGSFEEWENGIPVGWHVVSGTIARSEESFEGDFALRLEPPGVDAGDKGTRVGLELRNPNGVIGSRVRVSMMVSAPLGLRVGMAIYANDGGRVQVLTRNANGDPSWINTDGTGTWSVLANDVAISDPRDFRHVFLYVMLYPNSPGPALVDNVSIIVLE